MSEYTFDDWKKLIEEKLPIVNTTTDDEERFWSALKISDLSSRVFHSNYLTGEFHGEFMHFILLLGGDAEYLKNPNHDNLEFFLEMFNKDLCLMIDFFERTYPKNK